MASHKLDTLDKKILEMVAADARVPFLEVARACNVSGAAIHQRIAKLRAMGVLKGSQFVVNPEAIGYETCAYIGLYLKDPESFDDVVEKLKDIPEVTECHYTTGGFDMFIKIYAHNNHHLLNIIHDRLQPLGLSRSETIVSFMRKNNFPLLGKKRGLPRTVRSWEALLVVYSLVGRRPLAEKPSEDRQSRRLCPTISPILSHDLAEIVLRF